MAQDQSFKALLKSLPSNFWCVNVMEAFERFAFWGVRAISGLYLVASTERNGLALSYDDKGEIYMYWALIQCLLPMVSGGFTDRYGYRKSLIVAFTLNILGYLLMAFALPISQHCNASMGMESAGYWVFLFAGCLVGTGTAVFKPAIQGTIAKSTTEANASMGWGIFYWMINIGAAFGPMIAAPLRGEINWDAVFIAGAVITAINFIPTLFFFKEPVRAPAKEGEKKEGPIQVFISSVKNLFTDLRLLIFLLIFSCFWLMLQQLWDLMPNFIDEWVDTSDLAPVFGWFRADWLLASGQVKPEMVMAINSVSIILLVILVSWLVGKINKIAAMVIGMVISVVGFVGTGATSIGLACAFMLLVFSIGEMTCSPTFTAYVALIAPKAKKALYMGYAQLPLAIGWSSGNKIGGWLYENMASKFNLARQYMTEQLGMDPALVMDKAKLPETKVMDALAAALGDSDGPVTLKAATQVLWDQYEPYMVWYYLGIFGAVGTVGMLIFYFLTRRGKPENNAADGKEA